MHAALEALALAAATTVSVGLRATQGLNVVHGRARWVAPVALLLACVESYGVARVATGGLSVAVVLPLACGGTLGCLLAMRLRPAHKMPS